MANVDTANDRSGDIAEAHGLCVALHPDVKEIAEDGGAVRLRVLGSLELALTSEGAEAAAFMRALASGGTRLDDWRDAGARMPQDIADLLDRLIGARLLAWWYGTAQVGFVEIVPLSGFYSPLTNHDAVASADGDLDRLALADNTIAIPTPTGLTICDPLLLAELRVPATSFHLLAGIFGCGRDDAATSPLDGSLKRLLADAGFLREPEHDGPYRLAWSPREWWLHRQTRDIGQLREVLANQPPSRPPPPPRSEALPGTQKIRLRGPSRPSRSLAWVMEMRRSVRVAGARPLTKADLGALLWQIGRVRGDRTAVDPGLALRNIPSAGALCEMDFHLAIHRCDDVDGGLYRYDGHEHALVSVASGPVVDAMIADTAKRITMGTDERPDCVVVLTTRQAQLSQKYYGGAYRLSLIHVGVALEALYLAATDLGLSGCAAGFGNLWQFAKATGTHPYEETSLGEFALSGPAGAPETGQ